MKHVDRAMANEQWDLTRRILLWVSSVVFGVLICAQLAVIFFGWVPATFYLFLYAPLAILNRMCLDVWYRRVKGRKPRGRDLWDAGIAQLGKPWRSVCQGAFLYFAVVAIWFGLSLSGTPMQKDGEYRIQKGGKKVRELSARDYERAQAAEWVAISACVLALALHDVVGLRAASKGKNVLAVDAQS
jgi:hypothetical protein